ILLNWKDIVGVGIAEFARPERVVFSKDNAGVLYLRVSNGGHATFLQYAIPGIIEKISVYFGFRAISAIKIRQ
ncbi:MAG: DciA family protein, partial [Anaplasma sp.]